MEIEKQHIIQVIGKRIDVNHVEITCECGKKHIGNYVPELVFCGKCLKPIRICSIENN